MALVGEPQHGGGTGSVLPDRPDAELVALLTKEQFAGDEWRAVEAVLVATAIAVLHDMLLGGSVARKSLSLDRPVMPTPEEIAALRDDVDDRVDLVHAAVVDGIRTFRSLTLEGRGWREEAGASLMTYVVNGCVRSLANPFRAWRRRREHSPKTEPLVQDNRADRLFSPEPDALMRIIAEEEWTTLLASMPAQLARAAQLWRLDGGPWARIAAQLGISEKSLEGLRRRWRSDQRKQTEEGQ